MTLAAERFATVQNSAVSVNYNRARPDEEYLGYFYNASNALQGNQFKIITKAVLVN